MALELNGLRRMVYLATAIGTFGAAWAVIDTYAPWSPRITLSIAAENTLARLDNQLYTLVVLQEQARERNDHATVQRLENQIKEKKRLIEAMLKLQEKHK